MTKLTEEAKDNMQSSMVNTAQTTYAFVKQLETEINNMIFLNGDGKFCVLDGIKKKSEEYHMAQKMLFETLERLRRFKEDRKKLSDEELWEKYCV